MAVHHRNVQAAVLSRLKLQKTRIHSNHCAAITCDLLRQRAVAAAQVQDEISGFGVQQLQKRFSQVRDKSGVLRVALRVPGCRSL